MWSHWVSPSTGSGIPSPDRSTSLGPPAADYGLRLVLFRKLQQHCTTYISLSLPVCSCTIPAPAPLIKTTVASIILLEIAFFALPSNAPPPLSYPKPALSTQVAITVSSKQKPQHNPPYLSHCWSCCTKHRHDVSLRGSPPRSFPKETTGRGRGTTSASLDDNVQSPPQIIYDQPSSLDAGCCANQPTQATSPESASSSEIPQAVEINTQRHDVSGPGSSPQPARRQPAPAQPRADLAEVHAAPG